MSSQLHPDLKEMLDGYVECALWSSNDESDDSGGEPLDRNYSASDIAPSARKTMKRECVSFMNYAGTDASKFASYHGGWGAVGHDFWLTRNGHGVGFWDRGAGELGERLSKIAKKFGESHLYVGNDGKIHVS